MALRKWRSHWQQAGLAEYAASLEVKALFQSIQCLLVKVLLLDRETRSRVLQRGLLPRGSCPTAVY